MDSDDCESRFDPCALLTVANNGVIYGENH